MFNLLRDDYGLGLYFQREFTISIHTYSLCIEFEKGNTCLFFFKKYNHTITEYDR
jgi:hypothetical protein